MRGARRRWSVVGLVGAVLWMSACTGDGTTGSTSTPPPASSPVAVPFDPPSSFDLDRAVTLTYDQAVHSTLHGTTLFSVTDGTVQAADLADRARTLWSSDLPGDTEQDYLKPPFVLGATLLVATGKQPEGTAAGVNYVVNLTSLDATTGAVRWQRSVPVDSLAIDSGFILPDEWLWMTAVERDGGLLVSLDSPVTMLLDPATGEVRWQADIGVVVSGAGRYAVAADSGWSAVILDLQTGQFLGAFTDELDTVTAHDDPYGDESYVLVGAHRRDSTRYLRFSPADATVQEFVPAADDVRYQPGAVCSAETGQPVLLCLGDYSSTDSPTYGIDRASGQVVWTSDEESGGTMRDTTQFHGHVYGVVRDRTDGHDRQVVVALATGDVVTRDAGVWPLELEDLSSAPIKVNEYGAVGMIATTRPFSADTYAWVPATG